MEALKIKIWTYVKLAWLADFNKYRPKRLWTQLDRPTANQSSETHFFVPKINRTLAIFSWIQTTCYFWLNGTKYDGCFVPQANQSNGDPVRKDRCQEVAKGTGRTPRAATKCLSRVGKIGVVSGFAWKVGLFVAWPGPQTPTQPAVPSASQGRPPPAWSLLLRPPSSRKPTPQTLRLPSSR